MKKKKSVAKRLNTSTNTNGEVQEQNRVFLTSAVTVSSQCTDWTKGRKKRKKPVPSPSGARNSPFLQSLLLNV